MKTELIRKSFLIRKEDVKPDGSFSAVIATLGVIDKDGDVTRSGFIGKQGGIVLPVHDWNHVPMGKCVTSEEGDKVIAKGKFNLDIPAAKDWFSAMQFDMENGEPAMEWSYGFKTLPGGSSSGEQEGQKVRFLQPMSDGQPGCKFFECSPVVVGAGEGTRTLMAKSWDQNGQRFCDEALSVLDAVEDLVARGRSLADLRSKEGREMSAANKERLASLAACLSKAAQDVTSLLAGKTCKGDVEAAAELARMLKLRSGVVA
jgi:hypothetical protein